MKKLLYCLFLNSTVAFATQIEYTAEYKVTYVGGASGESYFNNSYVTQEGFKQTCTRHSKTETLNWAFRIIQDKLYIKSITVKCIDTNFNIVNIDLTEKILSKVKQ